MPAHERTADNGPTPPSAGFVKMMRTPDILELIEASPLAFALAALVALRARFRPGVSLKGLNPGEAFLGDYAACGLSEQQYRTAKGKLAEWGFATFRATNKGTVAKLIDTRLFDVLNATANGQSNEQATTPATDKQRLTKNGKKGKKGENGKKTLTLTDGCRRPTPSASSKNAKFNKPNSHIEVVAFALTQQGYRTLEVAALLKRLDFTRRAHDLLPELDDAVKLEVEWAFRFLHSNNQKGWRLRKTWQAAFVGFRADRYGSGPSSVPLDWVPHVAGVGGWPDDEAKPDQDFDNDPF